MTDRGTIVLGGSIAAKPGMAGHTWVFLQYLLGLRRLGWSVLFVDTIDPAACVAGDGRPVAPEKSAGVRYLRSVFRSFGLEDAFVVLLRGRAAAIGLTRERAREIVRSSAAFVNVMGFIADEDLMAAAPCRVFLDIDPGFPQMWRELGLHDAFAHHDRHVTIAENIGRPGCEVPSCGLEWITSRPPVVLERWPVHDGGDAFTSVGTWRGAFDPIEYGGKRYGLRVHEFRRFAHLPHASGARFRLALRVDPSESADISLLDRGGWELMDPLAVGADPTVYQRYIQNSRAEFMVAKNMYVSTRCGWFSDRSVCYLASGKPVLAQDTGIRELFPTGEGLVAFSTPAEALAGVAEIDADYARHARAAREIAEESFDSDRVLGRLLHRLGVG